MSKNKGNKKHKKTTGGYYKRDIDIEPQESANKLEISSDSEDESLDFNYLLKLPISTGSHLILKSEQEKFQSESVVNSSKYFNIDINLLNASIKSIPFNDRHEIKNIEWHQDEIDCMKEEARINEEAYKDLLINKTKNNSDKIEKVTKEVEEKLKISQKPTTKETVSTSNNNKESMENSSSDDEPIIKKAKITLPMPFEKCTKDNRKNDDPSNHQNRKRQIPHIEGNWASHIFIDCSEIKEMLTEFLQAIQANYSNINLIEAPHLSLSKNFILKYHWIDNFTSNLAQNVKFKSFELIFSPTEITFLSNEDDSRHFACMKTLECDNLDKLIKQIDKSLTDFELPTYYDTKIFHASFLWKLNPFTEDEKKFIREKLCDYIANNDIFDKFVDKITFKTGNKIKILHS